MENAFTVTPTSQSISLEPGQVYNGSIIVSNPSDSAKDFNYLAEITPYSVIGKLYDADLATVNDYSKITKWITIENPTGTVPPNQQATVNFTINVPSDAPAGGQYATISVLSDPEKDTTGATINNIYEIASVLYADVSGTTIREGEILDNSIPAFSLVSPIAVSATLENTGNVHQNAIITITAKNIFTGEIIYPKPEDEAHFSEIIMPGTKRLATRNVENLGNIGIFHISQEIIYDGKTSFTEKDVFICPIWFIILVLAVIFGIIFAIITAIRHKTHRSADYQ